MNNRTQWIDIAKFLGIFAIYVGHMPCDVSFVYAFHVPLFFFLSGCTENFNKETSFLRNITKNIKTILIPTFIFALLALLVYWIVIGLSFKEFRFWLIVLAKGLVRNAYFSAGLWFLTCLFSMKLLFLPLKMIKNRYVLFVVGILIFMLTNLLFNISPVINPQGWYNIDSAIYYLIYYVCGFVFYPSIEIFLKQDTRLKKMAFVFIGTYSLFFAVMLYCEKTILLIPMMNNLAIIINSLIKSFVMIAFVVLLSYMLNKVNILAKLGQRSLYLCGNETIIKMIVTALISELGLSMPIERVSIYIYVVVLLIFSYFLSYFEFPLFNKIKQFNFTNK